MLDNFNCQAYAHSNIILPASQGKGCLMLGDFNSAIDKESIKKNNIRTIVTAATNMDHLEIDKSLKHIIYPLLDSKTENICVFFQRNFDTLESSTVFYNLDLKRGGVLVHCAAGVSRSATLVIAYLMKKNSWSFKQAIAYVRKSRPQVCPNLGFELQLKKYQKETNKKGQERLSKTMIPSKTSNVSTVFNDFFSKQHPFGFPNITTYSRKQQRFKQEVKSRPMSKDEQLFAQQDKLYQKDFKMTPFRRGINPRSHHYYSSSIYKSTIGPCAQQSNQTDKKIAALMFHHKTSRSLGYNNTPLKKSDLKISGLR